MAISLATLFADNLLSWLVRRPALLRAAAMVWPLTVQSGVAAPLSVAGTLREMRP